LKFETPLTLSAIVRHADPDSGQVLGDLPRMHRRYATPQRLLHGRAPGAAEYGTRRRARISAAIRAHPAFCAATLRYLPGLDRHTSSRAAARTSRRWGQRESSDVIGVVQSYLEQRVSLVFAET
jgi:hypothetical protein